MPTLGKTLTLHGKSNNLYSNLAYIYLRQSKKKKGYITKIILQHIASPDFAMKAIMMDLLKLWWQINNGIKL